IGKVCEAGRGAANNRPGALRSSGGGPMSTWRCLALGLIACSSSAGPKPAGSASPAAAVETASARAPAGSDTACAQAPDEPDPPSEGAARADGDGSDGSATDEQADYPGRKGPGPTQACGGNGD